MSNQSSREKEKDGAEVIFEENSQDFSRTYEHLTGSEN